MRSSRRSSTNDDVTVAAACAGGRRSRGTTALLGAFLVVLALVLFGHAPPLAAESAPPPSAAAGSSVPALRCAADSGVWTELPDAEGYRLDAAYCVVSWPQRAAAADACPELVSVRFDARGVAAPASVATTPAAYNNCRLRWLGALGRVALYDDGERVVQFDADTLKLTGTLELPRGQVEHAPGGLLVFRDEARLVLLAAAEGSPRVVLDAKVDRPVALVWQPERLVVVEEDGMRWWARDPASGVPGGEPLFNAFGRPLGDAIWDLDPQGLVRSMSDHTRVGWFRFEPDSAFHFTVNAGGQVRAIDGQPNLAVFVSEGSDAKAYGRVGPYFKRRYEARYWNLEDARAPSGRRAHRVALRGEGERMVVLEGLLGARAAVLDVSGLTWRRVSVLELGTPGRLVSLEGTRLVTVHPGQDDAIVAWSIATGARLEVVGREATRAAGLDDVSSLEPLETPGLERWYLARDRQGRAAFFDASRHVLLARGPGAAPTGAFASSVTVLESGARLLRELDDDGSSVRRYHVLRRDAAPLELALPGALDDAMSAVERWYGYCAPGFACQATLPPVRRAEGSTEQWSSVAVAEVRARPITQALGFLGLSIVLLILVLLWRTDVGRRGKLDVIQRQQLQEVLASTELRHVLPTGQQRVLDSETLHLGPTTALIDRRGRRYVTEQDADGFVHRGWTHLPWRLGLALMVGAAVAIPTGFVYLVKEPLEVSLPYWLALWLPVSVVTFVLFSWGLWNRAHLLRYGLAIEGQWYDSGTRRASLCYTLPGGGTYRMRRGQWKRADLVPVVLVDPSRPRFAAQYTGHGSFPVTQVPGGARLRGTSVTLDVVRLFLVLLLCGGAAAGAMHAFRDAFPEPIASWTMATLEAEADAAGLPMLGSCLALCEAQDDDATCFRQCQSRQMRRVFEGAGIDPGGDPELMPGELRARQLERVEQVAHLMASGGASSCDALAASITAVPRWSARLETAFTAVYGGELSGSDELLPQVEARIAALGAEVFSPLCRPPAGCLDGSASCPQPPACVGPVDRLREAICSFGVAMTPLAPDAGTGTSGSPR